jgi:hypothetical protein
MAQMRPPCGLLPMIQSGAAAVCLVAQQPCAVRVSAAVVHLAPGTVSVRLQHLLLVHLDALRGFGYDCGRHGCVQEVWMEVE